MRSEEKLPLPSAILWDMDGTLIDQTAAIVRCFAEVITNLGYDRPDEGSIRRSLGGPMASTMGLFIPESAMETACTAFRARFPEIMFDGLIVLPGAMAFVERAHKARIPQVLFTNKHGDTARQVSRYAGFAKYVPKCIGSGDTEWHKPELELTAYVLEQIESPATGAVIIGDSPTDVAVARNARLACYGIATGAHSVEELLKAGADVAYESLPQLDKMLRWEP